MAPSLDARLERAQREVQQALEELREIAHGLYPVALADGGLAAAVESLSDRRPGLSASGLAKDRYAPAIEETAYFAIATLAERWTSHPVTIAATRRNERLTLDLSAPTHAPDDLVPIEDRLAALDGTLSIAATSRGQTRVRIELPCA